jgi:hypothetical protein
MAVTLGLKGAEIVTSNVNRYSIKLSLKKLVFLYVISFGIYQLILVL